jgi:hypothetical protein
MRFRRGWIRSFTLLASVGLAAGLLVSTASTAGGTPRNDVPPALKTTQIDVSNSNNPSCCPDLSNRYGEPEVAVNPKNPNNIVYVANQQAFTYSCQFPTPTPNCTLVQSAVCPFFTPPGGTPPPCQPAGLINNVPGFYSSSIFVSSNRGRTWTKVDPPGNPPGASAGINPVGDVTIAAAPDGSFYLAYDDQAFQFGTCLTPPGPPAGCIPSSIIKAGGIAVSKSTDGGLTWSTPTFTGTPVDRPFITVDASTGTIYEASGEGPLGSASTGIPDPSPPTAFPPCAPPLADRWLVASTDGGKTWSNPKGFNFGGICGPVSGPYVTAAHGTFAAAGMSNSGTVCGAITPCVVFQTTQLAGTTDWTRHILPNSSDSSGSPMVAADPSRAGHFTVAFADKAGTQFHVYQTFDSGMNWTTNPFPQTPTGGGIWHPWMSYSPTGVLGLMWQVNPPASHVPYSVWAALSDNGGATFTSPAQLATSPPTQQAAISFIGNLGDDFSFITLDRQYAYVAYADWSPGDRQGFMSTIKLHPMDHGDE